MAKKKEKTLPRAWVVEVERLVPSPDNRPIDESSDSFKSLRESIAGAGVQVPILCRPHPTKEGWFEIRDGERRWRAAKLAGLKLVPAIVREMNDAEALALTMIANLDREDLPPLEEGRLVAKLLESQGNDAEAVALDLGRTPHWVRCRAQMTKLTESWKKAVAGIGKAAKADIEVSNQFERWTTAHLLQVARLPAEQQDQFLRECGASWWAEGLSVVGLQNQLAQRHRLLAKAPWKLDDAKLVRKAGTCANCVKRSAAHGLLFHERLDPDQVKKDDRCLDARCWDKKLKAHQKQKIEHALAKHPEAVKIATDYYKGCPKDAFKAHEYKTAKKGAKGAVLGIVVKGGDAEIGSTKWVKTKHKQPSAMRNQSAPEAKKADTPAARLKALRAEHEQKRDEAYLETCRDTLESGKLNLPCRPKLVRMATCFGAFNMDRNGKGAIEEYRELQASDGDAAVYALLWPRIRTSILEENDIDIIEIAIEEGGLDLGALRSDTDGTVPEPPEIAQLEAEIAAAKKPKKQAKAKVPRKGSKPNKHGVYTSGVETVSVSTPKAAKAAVKIRLAVDEDGKFRAGYDFRLSGTGVGCFGQSSPPSKIHSRPYESRDDAIRAVLVRALSCFDPLGKSMSPESARRCKLVTKAIQKTLDSFKKAKKAS